MTEEGSPGSAGLQAKGVRGKEIHCQDGPVGRVADVLVDPQTGRPLYLVWREAVVVTKEVSIPVQYIDRIEEGGIVLRVEREAIERLPCFWTAGHGGMHTPANEGY